MLLKVIIVLLSVGFSLGNVVTTGTPLIISSIKASPFLMETDSLGRGGLEGFITDFTDELCNKLDYQCTIRLVKDGTYGYLQYDDPTNKNSTGKWTGMIGEVLNKECDLAIADLTMTSQRAQVIDFSVPIFTSRFSVVHKITLNDDDNAISMKDVLAILRPMSPMVWIIFVVVVLMYIGLISIIEMKFMPREIGKENYLKINPMNCPRSIGGKFLSIVFLVWLTIWTSIYISSLTSQRVASTVTNNNNGFTGERFSTVDEIVNDPFMKLGFVESGSTAMFFKKSNIPLYKTINNNALMEKSNTKSYAEGVSRVLDDMNGNYAFIMESQSAEYLVQQTKNLYIVPKLFGPSRSFAIAMRKGDPLMKKINQKVLELQEEAKIEQLYNKWWNINSILPQSTSRSMVQISEQQVTLKEICSLYLLATCGMLVGIGLVVLESRRNK